MVTWYLPASWDCQRSPGSPRRFSILRFALTAARQTAITAFHRLAMSILSRSMISCLVSGLKRLNLSCSSTYVKSWERACISAVFPFVSVAHLSNLVSICSKLFLTTLARLKVRIMRSRFLMPSNLRSLRALVRAGPRSPALKNVGFSILETLAANANALSKSLNARCVAKKLGTPPTSFARRASVCSM